MSVKKILHQKVTLLSTSEVRYEGDLYSVDPSEQSIALKHVNCMGTEGRRTGDQAIAPSDCTYEFIIFRAVNIRELWLDEAGGTRRDLTDDVLVPLRGQNASSTKQAPEEAPGPKRKVDYQSRSGQQAPAQQGYVDPYQTQAQPHGYDYGAYGRQRAHASAYDERGYQQNQRNKPRQTQHQLNDANRQNEAITKEHNVLKLLQEKQASKLKILADSNSVLDETVNSQQATIDALKQELKKNQTTIQLLSAEKEKSQEYAEAKQNALDAVQTKRDAEYDALKREMLQLHATHKKQMKSMRALLNSKRQQMKDMVYSKRDGILLERGALQQAMEKLKRINDAKKNCIVCQNAEGNHVFVPCGHVCICGDCKKHYEGADAECPVCRVEVAHVVRMFHA